MMKAGRQRITKHMSMEYDFTGIRLLDRNLIPVDWHLSVDLVAVGSKNLKKEELELQITTAYQKLYFWLDTNLPNVVVVNVQNEDDLYIANLSSNIMLYCPDEPYDDTIVELLHSKLTVLAADNLMVGEMRLKGSDMAAQYLYDCPAGDYGLPSTTIEYYNAGIPRDTIPWWARNDGFCFEFARPDDGISSDELFKDIVDPLEEFTRSITEDTISDVGAAKEPARIVQVEKWKPKKI